MKATHNISNSTTLTRLIPFVFAILLMFTSLATTGCGLVDSNDSEAIEEVASPPRVADDTADSATDDTSESNDGDSLDEEEGYEGDPPNSGDSREDVDDKPIDIVRR